MRRLLSMVLAALVMLSLVPALADSTEGEYQANEKVELVTCEDLELTEGDLAIQVGDVIHITLDANATTGYGWFYAIADETIATVVAEGYEVSPAEAGMVGSGGMQHYYIRALTLGESEITFRYKRSWMEDSAEDTLITYTIVVE